MENPTKPIKNSLVGKIRISTVYVESLHKNLLSLLEEIGKTDKKFAQKLDAINEEIWDSPEIPSSTDALVFDPYYETTVFGGRLDGKFTRCVSITLALVIHEEMVETVKADLRGSGPG